MTMLYTLCPVDKKANTSNVQNIAVEYLTTAWANVNQGWY